MKKFFHRIFKFWRIICILISGTLIYYFYIYEPPKSNLRKMTKEDLFYIEEKMEIDENGDTIIIKIWSSGVQSKTN